MVVGFVYVAFVVGVVFVVAVVLCSANGRDIFVEKGVVVVVVVVAENTTLTENSDLRDIAVAGSFVVFDIVDNVVVDIVDNVVVDNVDAVTNCVACVVVVVDVENRIVDADVAAEDRDVGGNGVVENMNVANNVGVVDEIVVTDAVFAVVVGILVGVDVAVVFATFCYPHCEK